MRWLSLLFLIGCIPRLQTSQTVALGDWKAPTNRWSIGAPPADTEGQGWEPGQTVPDIRLLDQFGDEVSLWQFHDKVVLFDISTMWCAPCQELAAETEATRQHFAEDPFVYLTILQENVEGGAPDQDDVNLWADNFGITGPVLGDGEKKTAEAVQQGQYPAVLVIGPDLKVMRRVNPPNDAEVVASIQAALGG